MGNSAIQILNEIVSGNTEILARTDYEALTDCRYVGFVVVFWSLTMLQKVCSPNIKCMHYFNAVHS